MKTHKYLIGRGLTDHANENRYGFFLISSNLLSLPCFCILYRSTPRQSRLNHLVHETDKHELTCRRKEPSRPAQTMYKALIKAWRK